MSKKFSIVKSLDESKMQEELLIYENENIGDPYIFMNRETIEALEFSAPLGLCKNLNSCSDGVKLAALLGIEDIRFMKIMI